MLAKIIIIQCSWEYTSKLLYSVQHSRIKLVIILCIIMNFDLHPHFLHSATSTHLPTVSPRTWECPMPSRLLTCSKCYWPSSRWLHVYLCNQLKYTQHHYCLHLAGKQALIHIMIIIIVVLYMHYLYIFVYWGTFLYKVLLYLYSMFAS